MSAFLRAIENINDISIDEKLVPHFKKIMQKTHNYFEKNNLFGAFDLDKFFDTYLFNSTQTEFQKLKIELSSETDAANYTSKKGIFLEGENKIILYETTDNTFNSSIESLYFNEKEEAYDGYLLHEFLHFLTLHGNIEFEGNSNKNAGEKFDYKKFAFIYEPLTERLKTKILNRDAFTSYPELTLIIKLIDEVFKVDSDVNFLRRDASDYNRALTQNVYDRFFKFSTLIANAQDFEETIYHYEPMMSAIFTTIKQKFEKEKNTITLQEYVDKVAQLYELLPFKNYVNYKKELEELNSIFIINQLEKNNIEANFNNVKELNNLINERVKDISALKVEKELDLSCALPVNFKNLNLCFLVSDNNLYVYNSDIEDVFQIRDVVLLSKAKPFKEQDYEMHITNNKKRTAHYLKDEGESLLIFDKDRASIYNNDPKEALKLDFEAGILTLEANGVKRVVNTNDNKKEASIQNFEKDFNKTLNSLKNLQQDNLLASA